MQASVETASGAGGDANKNKDMVRVLKGALRISKSKTGEVIYRTNKNEIKYLNRRLAKFEKDIIRANTNIECQKRDVLRKWSMVFGNQKTLCESIKSFDEMMNSAVEKQKMETLERSNQLENGLNSSREEDLVQSTNSWSQARAAADRRRSVFGNAVSMPKLVNPNRPRANQAVPRVVDSVPGSLPKINKTGSRLFSDVVDEKTEKHRQEQEREMARRFPDFSRASMESYFTEQQELHEELMTRNALNKLKTNVDEGHNFYKLRIRTKLPEDAEMLIESIQTDRSKTKSIRRSIKREKKEEPPSEDDELSDLIDEDIEKKLKELESLEEVEEKSDTSSVSN